MQTFGANVIPSPSDTHPGGPRYPGKQSRHDGKLGCAISEAIEVATTTQGCRYVLGSVLNQVLLHQSIIGLEAKKAMDILGEYRTLDRLCWRWFQLRRLDAPFMQDKLLGKKNPYFIAVEPASCPSLTRGLYAYDYCDTGKVTPLARMYTLGSGFIPSPNHAGGLRYHGMSLDRVQTLPRRLDRRSPFRRADQGIRRGNAVCARGDHPSRTGVLPRHPRGDRRGPQGARRPARKRPSCSA